MKRNLFNVGLGLITILSLTGCNNSKNKLVTCEYNMSNLPSQLVSASEKVEVKFSDDDKVLGMTMVIEAVLSDSVNDDAASIFKESQQESCNTGIKEGTYESCSVTLNGKKFVFKGEYPKSGIDEVNNELPEEYKKAQDEEGFKGSIRDYFAEKFSESTSGMSCKAN